MLARWSAQAWTRIEPTLEEIFRHPFVTGLAAGTLPGDKFAKYLAQDRIYLANYAREMRDLASMLPECHLSLLYRKFAEESMAAERELHRKMEPQGGDKGIGPEPLAGTEAYMRHTSGIISGGDLALSMAAMLPCMWVYNEVGKHILSIAVTEGNPYRDWIECYSSPLMDEGAECSVRLTDELAAAESDEKKEAMTLAFVKSTEFELLFWEQAYR